MNCNRIISTLFLVAFGILLSSCSMIRGYCADGLNGPGVALINIDSRKHRAAHAFGGITCTLKDLAKIGRLYLNNGMWDGKRIVSEEWIHLTTDFNPKSSYHYSWYDVRFEGFKTGQYPGFYAIGICNQVLYVNPHKRLIMVRIGEDNIGWATIPEVFEQLSNVWPSE